MTAAAPLVALAGNPNAGKSSLFNVLTGARQKIGNYPGVTVERHAGRGALPDGRPIEYLDLPGTYSLTPASPDEEVTRDVLVGQQEGERRPDALVIVVDACNLDNHLRFALELLALGLPSVIALNMVDMATRDGLTIDPARLSADLGVPVVPTVAVRRRGLEELGAALAAAIDAPPRAIEAIADERARRDRARAIGRAATVAVSASRNFSQRLDKVLLHPVYGFLILLAVLFVMFQSVFSLAELPMGWIERALGLLGDGASATLPEGILRDFLVQGVIGGVGAVVAFLPQIIILFLFILLLESTGYMARAAFLMDGLMARVGLSGRGFIPLLSSFACAIPGIMATRAIADPRDRLTTILIAPLMTCSARLPVYAVIIGAFIPARSVAPGVGLQGLVLLVLYLIGVVSAFLAALILRRTVTRGTGGGFLMELPRYQMPRLADVALGLWQRAVLFLRRAGTIIFATTIVLWLLLSFPRLPAGDPGSQLDYSLGGRIANGVAVVIEPIGFNRDIALALIPAMAAREVAVSALATTYAIDAGHSGDAGVDEARTATRLGGRLSADWSLATALAFLAWFVYAPQCISTIAVTRRETNGWKWPAFMVGYLFALAYVAAGATYWGAVALGWG